MRPLSQVSLVLHTIAETRAHLAELRRRGQSVGLVPTMGALHEGHGALIRKARAENDHVIVTVFVNPTQFDRKDDFEKYPRALETDLEFCERLGADAVFAPDAAEMYPGEPLTSVEVAGVSEGLEGEFRPGHFSGVATVVAKLFHIVPADRAYFGEKDAQQLAVIQRMVADLNFPIEIVPVATVREADGLAISSRNQRLTPEQRSVAPALYRALRAAEKAIYEGRDVRAAQQVARQVISEFDMRLEYVEIVDGATMKPVDRISGNARIVAAAWLGSVRLIDNLPITL